MSKFSRDRAGAACVALGLMTFGLTWAGPVLAQNEDSPFRKEVVQLMFGLVNGDVSAESASVGWETPVVLKKLQVIDRSGKLVLNMDEFRLTKTLTAVILDPRHPGPVKLTRPNAVVTFNTDGSCDYVGTFGTWHAVQNEGKTLKDLELEIIDGRLELRDLNPDRPRTVVLEDFQFKFMPPEKGVPSRTLKFSATLKGTEIKFAAEGTFDIPTEHFELTRLEVRADNYGVATALAGHFIQPEKGGAFQIQGDLAYDLERVAEVLRAMTGMDIRLTGRGSRPYHLSGNLPKRPAHVPVRVPPIAPDNLRIPLDVRDVRPKNGRTARPTALAKNLPQAEELPSPEDVPPPDPFGPQNKVPGPATTNPSANTNPPREATPPELLMPGPQPATGPRLSGGMEDLLAPVETGPHPLVGMAGNGRVFWTSAGLRGFEAGPGELHVRLQDGWLLIYPTAVEVNGGTLQLAGGIHVATPQPELVIAAGPVAQQIRLTPEMCARILQYAAPVMASTSRAEGSFSVTLDQCRIPLLTPDRGDLQGQLLIHNVDLETQNPLMMRLSALFNVPPVLKILHNSGIHFVMHGGRVYHQGLMFSVGGVVIQTEGSVGLDRTLDLVAEFTPPVNLLPNGPVGQLIRQTRFRVPITGTLDDPSLGKLNLQNGGVGNGAIADSALTALQQILGRRRVGPPGSVPPGTVPPDPTGAEPPPVGPGPIQSLLQGIRDRRNAAGLPPLLRPPAPRP